tara:strand:- start:155 stop:562 length:408 start_codon:yes stop_codon:yes gene_type:complete
MSKPNSVTVTCGIGLSAIGGTSTADDYYVCHGQSGEWRLAAAYFCPALAVTANGTNYVTMMLSQGFEGTETDIATAMTTATVDMTVGTVREFTMSENTSRVFGPTDVLMVDVDEAGTFSANLEGTVVLRFEQERA